MLPLSRPSLSIAPKSPQHTPSQKTPGCTSGQRPDLADQALRGIEVEARGVDCRPCLPAEGLRSPVSIEPVIQQAPMAKDGLKVSQHKKVCLSDRLTQYPPKPTLLRDPSICTFRTLHLLAWDAHAASFAASVGEHESQLQANDEDWTEQTFSYANGLKRLQDHKSELEDYHAVVKEFQEGFQTRTTSSEDPHPKIAAIHQELAEKLQLLEREVAHIDDLIHVNKTTVRVQNDRIARTRAKHDNDFINQRMDSIRSSGTSDEDEEIHFGEMLRYAIGGGALIIQQLHADLGPLVRSFEQFGSLFNRARSDSVVRQRMAQDIVDVMDRMLTLLQSRLSDYRIEGGRNKDFVGWMNDTIDSLSLERRMWEARAKRVSNFLSAPSSALVQPGQ